LSHILWRTEKQTEKKQTKQTKKDKKQKKTSVKHIRIRLIGGCVKSGPYQKAKRQLTIDAMAGCCS